MSLLLKVLKHQVLDLGRSRWVLAYLGLILLLTQALVRFGGGPRAVVSLLNLVLMLVPLTSLVFGAMHVYSSREFIELLLAQPIRRRALFVVLGEKPSSELGLDADHIECVRRDEPSRI